MAYYDPTTRNAVDPTKVTSYISGYDEWNNPINGYRDATGKTVNQASGTGVNGWGDWLAGEGVTANARSYNRLQNYMEDLSTKYGLGADDFIKGFQAYGVQYNPGATDENGNVHGFGRDPNMGFWGEDAMLRALGDGLDKANPGAAYNGSWKSLWDRQRELGQQNEIANIWQENQDRFSKANDFVGTDLPTILGGLGLVAGAGALSGAFGGSGVFGGGSSFPVGGADWMSEIAAGAGNGGATLGSYVPAADAVGNFVPAEAAGGVGGGSGGGNVDLLDSIVGDNSGYTVNNIPTDPYSSTTASDVLGDTGSDWSRGLDTAMNPGNQGPTGFWDQAKSFLSQGKNIPTSLIKSFLGTDDATAASLSRLLGTGIGGLLDYNASTRQADNLKAIADRSWAAGQPYRDRANAAMTPGFDIKSIPGLSSAMDTATETYLRKLSATNGNPAGIGAAPSQTEAFVLGNVALPAWQNYFNANSNAGGLSNLSASANATATNAAGADSAVYGSLGQTARNLFDPQPSGANQYLKILSKAYGLD